MGQREPEYVQVEGRALTRAGLRPTHVAVAGLTLLVGILGMIRLGHRGLSLDEVVSIRRARESWPTLFDTVTDEDPNMSLYYGLLKLWTGLFGDGVVSVRRMSVLFAALTVPVVFAIGKRLFGEIAGIVAALLLSVNAYFLRYAQEARAYSLVVLLVGISSLAFLAELERPRLRNRVTYVAASVLAFYAHYYAAWVTAAQAATLLASRRRSIGRTWVLAYGVIGVAIAPMALAALTLDHNPISWLGTPGWRAVWEASAQLAGDSFRELGAILAVCLLAIPFAARSPRLRWGLGFTAVWTLLPITGAFVVSQFHPIFLAKYLIVCLPAAMLLAAGAVTSLRPAAATGAILAFILLTAAPPMRAWYRSPGEQDWGGMTRHVLANSRSGDGVVFNMSYARSEFLRFSRKARTALPEVVWEEDPSALTRSGNPRIWLALFLHPADDEIRRRLETAYERSSSLRFEGKVGLELYVKRELSQPASLDE